MNLYLRFGHSVQQFLHRPVRVFWACAVFVGVSLLINGTLLRLYSLHRDQFRLLTQTRQVQESLAELDKQLKEAQDPSFMERQAMDRYDLADENDLVFVFSDD